MSQSDQCSKDWVQRELALWEEGLNAKIAELRAEVNALGRRLKRLEEHQLDPFANTHAPADRAGQSWS